MEGVREKPDRAEWPAERAMLALNPTESNNPEKARAGKGHSKYGTFSIGRE